jgi:hypothetical protein
MLVQPKKHDPNKLTICVNFLGLIKWTLTDPLPTPFSDEIIKKVIGHEWYSFNDRFLGYNQVPIAKEDQEKKLLC